LTHSSAIYHRTLLYLVGQLRELTQEAKYSYQFSRSLSPLVLFLIIVAYIGSSYVEHILAELNFETFWLRVFVAVWVPPFLLRDYWPEFLARTGYILWTVSIGVVLPVCFGLILVVNAAMTPPEAHINYFAIAEYVLSLFFLVQILFHIRLVLVVWTTSSCVVALSVLSISEPNVDLIWANCLYVLPFFLTVLLMGGIINRSLFNFQRDKEQAVWNIANAIAHQLRTPLATIRNLSTGSKNNMPRLVDGYHKAIDQNLIEQPISERKLTILDEALDSITNEVQHSNALIDILIANSKPFEYHETPKNRIHISGIIHKAVDAYPYNNPHERALVTVDTYDDFEISALENMVLHVMFNLVANAVEFSQKSPNGQVKIWLEQGAEWNKVYFWDNGIGIPRKYLHLVFDPFFSRNSQNGTGIGLSFCKSVMEGVGGKITCDSKEGKYCQFSLFFPTPSV
jgi:signal transduction histidine kinase